MLEAGGKHMKFSITVVMMACLVVTWGVMGIFKRHWAWQCGVAGTDLPDSLLGFEKAYKQGLDMRSDAPVYTEAYLSYEEARQYGLIWTL